MRSAFGGAGAPGHTDPTPADVTAHDAAGGSPFGVLDLVGNVWQYTDEFQDDHTVRAAALSTQATATAPAKLKVGINGFGRIGRLVLRSILARDDIEVRGPCQSPALSSSNTSRTARLARSA